MFPASAIRAFEQSGTKLVVVCPPFYGAAVFSFALAVVMFAATWLAAGRDLGRTGMLVLLASNVPFLLISAGLATTGAAAIVDTRAGFVHVRTRIFGIPTQQVSLPLSSVAGAAVQTGRRTHRLSFQLHNGSTVPLGFFTNQAGHDDAANAINSFLRRHAAAAGR